MILPNKDGTFSLYSHTGRVLKKGTKEEVNKREKQINYFKHKDEIDSKKIKK